MPRTQLLARRTESDVDLLARIADVEPAETVLLKFGHGVGDQAESVAVKGLGEVEGGRGNEHVYVGEGGDHCDGGAINLQRWLWQC